MGKSNYICETAKLLGNVCLGSYSSLLPNAVVRGDLSSIQIGSFTNIQDNCVVHCERGFPVDIGHFVTVGHGAVVHGTAIGDFCVIGMKSILLNGVRIGRGSIVAAGAVVKEKTIVPPFSLVVGSPAVVKENRYTDVITPVDNALIYFYLSRCYLRKRLPDDREISMIYDLARKEAERISEAVLRGEDMEGIFTAIRIEL